MYFVRRQYNFRKWYRRSARMRAVAKVFFCTFSNPRVPFLRLDLRFNMFVDQFTKLVLVNSTCFLSWQEFVSRFTGFLREHNRRNLPRQWAKFLPRHVRIFTLVGLEGRLYNRVCKVGSFIVFSQDTNSVIGKITVRGCLSALFAEFSVTDLLTVDSTFRLLRVKMLNTTDNVLDGENIVEYGGSDCISYNYEVFSRSCLLPVFFSKNRALGFIAVSGCLNNLKVTFIPLYSWVIQSLPYLKIRNRTFRRLKVCSNLCILN